MIKLVSAMGLAALMLSPAMAAPAARHHARAVAAPEYMYDGASSSPGNPVVIVAGKYIGRDPDANIRTDLTRQAGNEVD